MNVCFFCASSEALEPKYYTEAEKIASIVAKKNWTVVTGGSKIGLMKTLTLSALKNNGKTIGIIPSSFAEKGLACFDNTKLILTKDMSERKNKLFEISDAFVILPGGFGTLDEMLEIITLRQVGVYNKPIAIFNQDGFFDGLLKQFEVFFDNKFAKKQNKKAFFVTDSIEKIIDHIENFKVEEIDDYWFDVSKKVFE